MAPSESEGDEIDDIEFENGTSDADGDEEEADEEVLDTLDNDLDDATEGDDVCSV
jgi:transcriptional activator SPT8